MVATNRARRNRLSLRVNDNVRVPEFLFFLHAHAKVVKSHRLDTARKGKRKSDIDIDMYPSQHLTLFS